MTVVSMTGFARARGSFGLLDWAWELKSVNGKGLEPRFRLPPGYDGLEVAARQALFGYRAVAGAALKRWIGGAAPFTDAAPRDSYGPTSGHTWYG